MKEIKKKPKQISRDEYHNTWDLKKNTLDGIGSRLYTAKEKASELEAIAIEMINRRQKDLRGK